MPPRRDYEQKVREALMTVAEAEEYAASVRDTGARFLPRWRVENTPAGNSCLLRKQQAYALQRKYGGTVVELVKPARQGRRAEKCKGLATCPRCGAPAGARCWTAGGRRANHPHAIRQPALVASADQPAAVP